jgi:hypothetical protein
MKKGVHHHVFRHITRQSKPDDEDRATRKRPARESTWRVIPQAPVKTPEASPAEGAAGARSVPPEQIESEDTTLLPAA